MTFPLYATQLSILLVGPHLIPDNLTDALGVRPDRFFRKGDSITTSGGNCVIRKTGLWSIRSQLFEVDNLSANILDDPFFELLPRLEKIREMIDLGRSDLSHLPGVERCYADYYIFKTATLNGTSCQFLCSPQQMKLFHELGLQLQFSLQVQKNDEELE